MLGTQRMLTLAVVLIALPLTLLTVTAQTTTDELIGDWESIACELRPGPQYLERFFAFDDERWYGTFPNYADPTCETLTLTFYAEGPYTLGDEADVAENAVDGEFAIDTVILTPHVQDTVDFLNSAPEGDCGGDIWELDVEQDVSETGCSLLGVDLSEPVVEYEVVLVRDDYLFFGARPVDGSGIGSPELRPTALQVPLVRGMMDSDDES